MKVVLIIAIGLISPFSTHHPSGTGRKSANHVHHNSPGFASLYASLTASSGVDLDIMRAGYPDSQRSKSDLPTLRPGCHYEYKPQPTLVYVEKKEKVCRFRIKDGKRETKCVM